VTKWSQLAAPAPCDNGNFTVDSDADVLLFAGDTTADSGDAGGGAGGDALGIAGGEAAAANASGQGAVNALDVADGTSGEIQDNDASIDAAANTATGGDATGLAGKGGDASTGGTQADNGNVHVIAP